MKRLLYMFALIGLAACQPSNQVQQKESPYYDIAGLIAHQAAGMASANTTLTKSTELDGEVDQYTDTLTEEDWKEELRFFTEVDLNQPILLDAYNTSESVEGALTLTRYSPKTQRKNGVQWLEIREQNGRLTSLTAETNNKNMLYRTARTLQMHFEPAGDSVRLADYSVEGYQQMILKDSVGYRIEGVVLYP